MTIKKVNNSKDTIFVCYGNNESLMNLEETLWKNEINYCTYPNLNSYHL